MRKSVINRTKLVQAGQPKQRQKLAEPVGSTAQRFFQKQSDANAKGARYKKGSQAEEGNQCIHNALTLLHERLIIVTKAVTKKLPLAPPSSPEVNPCPKNYPTDQ